jgi:hypothetical protein
MTNKSELEVDSELQLLPDDFARQVITRVREVRRRQRQRRRITAAAAVFVIAGFPLALLMHSRHQLQIPDSSLEADYDQMARVDEPRDVVDYIMPSADTLNDFNNDYSSALWTEYSNPSNE